MDTRNVCVWLVAHLSALFLKITLFSPVESACGRDDANSTVNFTDEDMVLSVGEAEDCKATAISSYSTFYAFHYAFSRAFTTNFV